MSKYYITTAIPYASAKPHIGNTLDALMVDAVTRYRRLRGDDVYFLTGADEHGQKIENAAAKAGISPQEYANGITGEMRSIWDLCMVEYDDFIRTTEPRHKTVVQKMFKKLYDQGDIYKDAYEGWYCVPDEAFHTESQIVKGENGNLCPDCGRPVEWLREEAYFFRLSAYADRLAAHIEDNPEFLQPENRKNEIVNNFIKPGLQDFCVSRTSFTWGVPVEFDPGHVIYVWMDALSNYITALGYDPDGSHGELFQKYWPCDVHMIGKDILRFHALYWPGILLALGVPLPKKVFAHPWILMGSDRLSKSLGNVLYAPELVEKYGVDCVRYYCLREIPFAKDGQISHELIVSRCNTDLANNLGNLLSRSVAMGEKYFRGSLPVSDCAAADDYTRELDALWEDVRAKYTAAMDILHTQAAMQEVFRLLDRANLYIDQTEPWVLAKDEAKKPELCRVLFNLCQALRRASILLYPAMPRAVRALRGQLGLPETPEWDEAGPDSYTVKKGANLFPRIEPIEG